MGFGFATAFWLPAVFMITVCAGAPQVHAGYWIPCRAPDPLFLHVVGGWQVARSHVTKLLSFYAARERRQVVACLPR